MIERIAVFALINYLVTLYAVYEDGPKGFFGKIRHILGINKEVKDVSGDIIDHESNGSMTANLLSCHTCFGFWSGVVIGLVGGLDPVSVIAATALSIFMHEITS